MLIIRNLMNYEGFRIFYPTFGLVDKNVIITVIKH